MIKRSLLKGGVSIIGLVSGGAAIAQAVEPAPVQSQATAPAASDDSVALGEIVVTAQKRSERLQDVPVTVSAVTAETLNKTGVESTQSLVSLIPGLNVNSSISGFRPFLRGVGTVTANAGNENSVSTYVDNVYMTSLNQGLANLSSIEAVEVLKGPQGTLFGRNATGGVVNIKTKNPSHNFGGKVTVGYDNYETLVGIGYVTGGLSENLAADLAVYYSDQGQGYGHNLFTGNEVNKDKTYTIRSKVMFTPSPQDTFILAADYSRLKTSGLNSYHPFPGTTVEWGPPDATHPPPKGAPYTFPGGPWDADVFHDPFAKNWAAGASLTYDHEFDWATLRSITSYRRSRMKQAWNATPVPVNVQYAGWNQPERQFTQELQLSSLSTSDVKWILGLYYIKASAETDPFFIFGTAQSVYPNRLEFVMKQSIDSPAAYGQVTVPVPALGDTNITGGLRYTIDKRSIVGRTQIVTTTPPITVVATPASGLTDASKTFKTFTWRLSIDHHFTPDVMIFASYNRGFKAGAYNTIPPGGPTATPTNPEFLDAYEIGLKSKLLDGKLIFNTSAFYYDYKDLQVTIYNQTSAVTVNAAAARIIGVDVDATAQLSRYLRVNVGAELLDHKYTDYPNYPVLTPVPIVNGMGGGVARTFPVGGNARGNALSYTSDAVVNGALFFEYPTDSGTFDFNTNVSWNSGFTFEPSEVVASGEFVDLSATAGFTLANGTTRFQVFGKNLLNEKVPRVLVTGGNPGGYIETTYRPPRTYGVRISQEF
ncbi:MAG TPA: TonB-dependent receptor [Allosphingosinicella sp.]|nr:TonB-dependent receptor [Allosphingosinicella sp.]